MKKYLIHLLYFFLPLIIVAYSADIFISGKLKRSLAYADGEYEIWNAVFDGKMNVDIAIYGSSRAMVQIDTKILGDSLKMTAYNLGLNGLHFDLQQFRHKMLLKYNKKPKLIIQSLDVFTLQKLPELFNQDQFLPYMLWNTPVLEATINHIGYNYLDYKIPLLRYYGKREAMKVATKIFLTSTYGTPIRFKGYEGVNLSWNSDLDKAKSKMESYSVKIDTALLAAFKQYLADCRQKNIKLVFVYTPEYKNGQAFVKNREQLISLYKELATQYNIPFYDYSDDALSYQKKYFYNVEHLNRIGSELFTRKFIDTLKKSDLLKSITHK